MYMASMSTLNPRAPEFFPNYYHGLSHEPVLNPHVPASTNHPHQQYYLPTVLLPSYNYQNSSFCCHYSNPPSSLLPAFSTTATITTNSSKPADFPSFEVSEGHSVVNQVVQVAADSCVSRDSDLVSGSSLPAGRGGRLKREGCQVTTKQQWVKVGDQQGQRRKLVRRSLRCSKQGHSVVPVQPDGLKTTVMIRNIPNRYTRGMLMEFLDDHCMVENQKAAMENTGSMELEKRGVSAFDFLYLPMDFGKEANKGYAFVNFTNPRAAWKFYVATHNQAWDHFQSRKIREIATAKLQGKEELVRHFQSSYFVCQTDDFLPVCFTPPRDGSKVMVSQRTIGKRIGKVPNL